MGLRVIRPEERSEETTQTPGMVRAAGVSADTTGAERIWMGYVELPPGSVSGVHHHGESENGIYIVQGRARFEFGERLEHAIEAGPGDFVHVPPFVLHREINLDADQPVEEIVARTSQETLVYNVEWPPHD